MKRIAYIGLSSPTAYFYDHDQKYFKEEWRWNPILESPQGLITLFDEIWFLSRALCPISLRNEKYVKFIDEDSDYIPLIKFLAETQKSYGIEGILNEQPFIENIIDLNNPFSTEQFKRYDKVIESVYGRQSGEAAPIDNHSHSINLCGSKLSGNSMSLDLLAFDIAFLNKCGVRNIELITNSFNSTAFKNKSNIPDLLKISQGITVKRIPVLQAPVGPIIDRIESIRESNFLVDFRNKILKSETSDNFNDIIVGVEREFNKYRNDVLLSKQRGSKLMNSLGNNAISMVIGTVIPGVGEVKSLLNDAAARNFNWTGFLAEIE